MKSLKKIVISFGMFCIATLPIIAKDKQENAADADNRLLRTDISRREPLDIDFKKIVNPTEIAVSNSTELEKTVERIAKENKKKKYDADKELQKALKNHAQGQTEGRIFTSKQALDFFNLDIHEQIDQLKKWLKEHNTHQTHQLKDAQHDYNKKIATFNSEEKQKALETVQNIEDEIKTRKHKISTLSNKLEKLSENNPEYQQKQDEIMRLERQNNIDRASIEQHLFKIMDKHDELDAEFKQNCHKIIEKYQEKNHELLNTVNTLVKSKKQAFALKTAEKKLQQATKAKPKPKPKMRNNPEIATFHESVILAEGTAALAKNPLLNTLVEQTRKDIAGTSKSSDEYKTLKQELAHLKNAQHIRDIQQK